MNLVSFNVDVIVPTWCCKYNYSLSRVAISVCSDKFTQWSGGVMVSTFASKPDVSVWFPGGGGQMIFTVPSLEHVCFSSATWVYNPQLSILLHKTTTPSQRPQGRGGEKYTAVGYSYLPIFYEHCFHIEDV